MPLLKTWKTNWELKSLSFDELFNVVVAVVTKQLDDIDKENVHLESNFALDYEADSVDVVGMLLTLEEIFRNASTTIRTVVPTNELGLIHLVEDLLSIIYEVLVGIETKMEVFTPIQPNLDALKKRQQVGELYPKTKETISPR